MILKKRAEYHRDRQAAWRNDPANAEKVKESNRRSNGSRRERSDYAESNHQRYVGVQRDSKYMNRYGIGLAAVESMAVSQGNKCRLCGKPGEIGTPGKKSRLCVDHDHVTGTVRGLLCQYCNVRMAAIDDEDWLAAAIAYRDAHR